MPAGLQAVGSKRTLRVPGASEFQHVEIRFEQILADIRLISDVLPGYVVVIYVY